MVFFNILRILFLWILFFSVLIPIASGYPMIQLTLICGVLWCVWCVWDLLTYDEDKEFEKECIRTSIENGDDPCMHGRFDCFCYLGGPPKSPRYHPRTPFSCACHFEEREPDFLEDCASECSDEFLAE
jgi:hypothetical protein